jgi:hypothetical protein
MNRMNRGMGFRRVEKLSNNFCGFTFKILHFAVQKGE